MNYEHVTPQNAPRRSSTPSRLVDDLNEAVIKNPVAAGLIGAGVLWMLFGNHRIAAAAGSVGSAAAAGGQAVTSGLSGAASQVSGAARRAGESVAETAQAMASAGREQAASAYDAAADAYDWAARGGSDVAGAAARGAQRSAEQVAAVAGDYGASLKKSMTEALDRQPLLLGALGLAIGAGIASAFRTTSIENTLMGEAGDAVRMQAEALVEQAGDLASSHAQRVVDEVKGAARENGLDTSASRQAVKSLTEKVENVAAAARDSVSGRLS